MNAELVKAQIKIMADRERTVSFDWNALCAIEKVTGKNLVLDTSVWSKPDANLFRALVYGVLLTDDPSLTVEKTGQLMTQYPHIIETCLIAARDGVNAIVNVQKKSE